MRKWGWQVIKSIPQSATKATGEAYFASLPYSALTNLPEEQVKFLITATRIANDILLLQRLLIASENNLDKADHAEKQAGIGAWFGAITLLAGKLWEAYGAISRYARLWKSDSDLVLESPGIAARAELNNMFANGSPLDVVRNKSAFHYDGKEVLEAEVASFRSLTETADEMKWILGSEIANTFYLFSAASNGIATLEAAYPGKPKQEQMDSLYDDTIGAAAAMGTFLQYAFVALLSQPRVRADDQIKLEQIAMSDRPQLASITFPMLTSLGNARNEPDTGRR
jgi:hypothetical protein